MRTVKLNNVSKFSNLRRTIEIYFQFHQHLASLLDFTYRFQRHYKSWSHLKWNAPNRGRNDVRVFLQSAMLLEISNDWYRCRETTQQTHLKRIVTLSRMKPSDWWKIRWRPQETSIAVNNKTLLAFMIRFRIRVESMTSSTSHHSIHDNGTHRIDIIHIDTPVTQVDGCVLTCRVALDTLRKWRLGQVITVECSQENGQRKRLKPIEAFPSRFVSCSSVERVKFDHFQQRDIGMTNDRASATGGSVILFIGTGCHWITGSVAQRIVRKLDFQAESDFQTVIIFVSMATIIVSRSAVACCFQY